MNKFFRKTAAFMFAAALMAQASVGASAININVEGQGVGSSYRAFQLLSLNTSLKATGHDAHPDGEHTDDCYNYAYTVNSKYRDYLRQAMGNTTATDTQIIDYIRGLDADGVRAFADTLYTNMYTAMNNGTLAPDGVATADTDAKETNVTILVPKQGYYMISEAVIGSDPDSKSLVMLDTLGQDDITVKTKEDIPSLTKKIIENGTEVDAIDIDAADEVEFELKGTIPKNIGAYDKYYYEFHDTLANGLSVKDGSMSVTVDGATAEMGTDFLYENTDNAISVKCADLKAVATKLGKTLSETSTVSVKYKAQMNANAVSGQTGNPNVASLEFSNNPYDQADGKTSTTSQDKVQVFTYDVIVNKVDGAGQPLKGANFTLQKKGEDGTFADFRTNTFDADQTQFRFDNLDKGEYQIVEITVPDGYNGSEPVPFEIKSTYDTDSADPKLTDLKVFIGGAEQAVDGPFTVTLGDGEISTSITNSTGTILPGTGGSGVYGFYIGGSVLLAAGGGALIYLHKRKKNTAE